MRTLLACVVAIAVVTEAQEIPEPKVDLDRLAGGGVPLTLDRTLVTSIAEKPQINGAETAILSASGSPMVLGRLVSIAEDGSAVARATAIYGLGLLRDGRSLPLLERIAREDKTAAVREAALHALSVLDERAGHEAFLAALDDSSSSVRRVAAIGIALSSSEELWTKATATADLNGLRRYAPASMREAENPDELWPETLRLAFGGREEKFADAIAAIRKRFRQTAPYLEGPLGFSPPPVEPSFVSYLETRASEKNREAAVVALLLLAPDRLPPLDEQETRRLAFLADRFGRSEALQRNVRPELSRCHVYYPPAMMRRAPTYYPESLKRSAEEAVVIVNLTIDRQGAIRDVRLVSPTPKPEFAGAAFYSLRAWRFYPAVCDGERVDSNYRLTFNFTLRRDRPQMEELEALPRTLRP